MSQTKEDSRLERQMAAKRKKKIIAAIQYTLAIIITLISLFPIYWMISSSVKSQEEILLLVPTLWPREIHLENYVNVFNRVNFGKYYYNSLRRNLLKRKKQSLFRTDTNQKYPL